MIARRVRQSAVAHPPRTWAPQSSRWPMINCRSRGWAAASASWCRRSSRDVSLCCIRVRRGSHASCPLTPAAELSSKRALPCRRLWLCARNLSGVSPGAPRRGARPRRRYCCSSRGGGSSHRSPSSPTAPSTRAVRTGGLGQRRCPPPTASHPCPHSASTPRPAGALCACSH